MLDYEWANTSSIMLSGEEAPNPETQQTHHNHQLDTNTYTDQTSLINNHNNIFLHPNNDASTFTHFHAQNQHIPQFFEPRAYPGASSYPPPHMLSLDPVTASACGGGNGMFVVPKSEEVSRPMDFTSRIGLNLGGRTYFSLTEDDFVNRLYRRSRAVEPGSSHSPRCQAEGCNADLTHAKHYHRRHKVCEYHSKAATVVAAGLTQRFCQQCSRFHLLSEFDNGKRSCRKRLADHNRRRRKSHQANQESQKNQLDAARTSSSDNIARSPPDSAGAQSSSVTIAMSPPRILLDCFRQRPYQGGTTSSNSSSSVFFSTG